MTNLTMIEIVVKVNNQIPLSQKEAEYLLHECERLHEMYIQAKSEAFQAQRELWRKQ